MHLSRIIPDFAFGMCLAGARKKNLSPNISMSNHPIDTIQSSAHTVESKRDFWTRLDELCNPRRLAILAFLIGVVVMLLYKPFDRPEIGDPTIYDYVAQSILRGQLPYRDVIDIKTPGAQYLSALTIAVGSVFDVRDIFAIRALHVVLVGLLSVLIFLVTNVYLQSRVAAAIAVLIPLLREPIAKTFIGGTQPKLPMIIFGLLTLIMIAKDRPLAAGVFSMLSCLCWQPGLLFTGTAMLIFSRYFTSWRDLKALKVLAGAIIPLSLVLGYFYSKGALADLWAWTITYNYSVFGPEAGPTLGEAIKHIVMIVRRVFERDVLLVLLSIVGLLLFLVRRAGQRVKNGSALGSTELFRDAIVLPPLIYGVFMLINFQGPPDLIPIVPFVGIFASWALVWFASVLGQKAPVAGQTRLHASELVGAVVFAVILAVVFWRAGTFKLRGLKLRDQDAAVAQLRQDLQSDRIYVHGAVELLVLLNTPNLNPYVDFDWGKDNFAASMRGVSFQYLLDEMEVQAPKYVALTRLRKVYHRKELKRWVEERYQPVELWRKRSLYVRR